MDNDYNIVLNNYYQFKQKYEGVYNKAKSKIRKKQLTMALKVDKIKEIKRTCLNCGQIGGMVFSNENRILKAVCNAGVPCKFHIELNLEKTLNINNDLNDLRDDLEEIMSDIIKRKLYLLFELEDEEVTTDEFLKLKLEYTEVKALIDELEIQVDIIKQMKEPGTNDTIYRVEMYNKIHSKLQKQIYEFKDLLKRANLTENSNLKAALVKDAIETYIIQILPDKQFLRDIKYKYSAIEEIESEVLNKVSGKIERKKLLVLFQKTNLVEELEYDTEIGTVVSNIHDISL